MYGNDPRVQFEFGIGGTDKKIVVLGFSEDTLIVNVNY